MRNWAFVSGDHYVYQVHDLSCCHPCLQVPFRRCRRVTRDRIRDTGSFDAMGIVLEPNCIAHLVEQLLGSLCNYDYEPLEV